MEIPDFNLTFHGNVLLAPKMWWWWWWWRFLCCHIANIWESGRLSQSSKCFMYTVCENRGGQGDSIPSWYCINLKGFWSIISDSYNAENTDQRWDPTPSPRSCNSVLWPAELLNARMGDISYHGVWQVYKARRFCLSLLFCVKVLLSESPKVRIAIV